MSEVLLIRLREIARRNERPFAVPIDGSIEKVFDQVDDNCVEAFAAPVFENTDPRLPC